jgi:ubiquinone/menaquinone biosynthesis C-methylase UbiE
LLRGRVFSFKTRYTDSITLVTSLVKNMDLKGYNQANEQIGYVIKHNCLTDSEVKLIKHYVQDSYNSWNNQLYDKAFMNWGLWDKNLYNEYLGLDFNFYTLCNIQDIYSQLLIYSLIRPLIKTQFFNKRLLDIGCGNGIGLKAITELLETSYALGIDLTSTAVINSHNNFYKADTINYIRSDAENLAVENESFDIVTNLESSHLYPRIEDFFSEVERVLSPGGFFCYADMYVPYRPQTQKFEAFLKTRKNLKIILKQDITKNVQSSIYQRLIVCEDSFYIMAQSILGKNINEFCADLPGLASACGITFLPKWKIWFKNPILHKLTHYARSDNFWKKKYYFYYLIQKDEK